VKKAAEKSASRNHDRLTGNGEANVSNDSSYQPVSCYYLRNASLLDIQSGLPFQNRFQPKLISLFIALRPWSSNARTFIRVEHPEMNSGRVGVQSHGTTECINLADDVSLRESANRRITRHLPNRIQILR
jgi:hypothetical protein